MTGRAKADNAETETQTKAESKEKVLFFLVTAAIMVSFPAKNVLPESGRTGGAVSRFHGILSYILSYKIYHGAGLMSSQLGVKHGGGRAVQICGFCQLMREEE